MDRLGVGHPGADTRRFGSLKSGFRRSSRVVERVGAAQARLEFGQGLDQPVDQLDAAGLCQPGLCQPGCQPRKSARILAKQPTHPRFLALHSLD